MAADMDIEMDLDVGFMDEDLDVPEIEIIPEFEQNPSNNGAVPNDSSAPDALQPTPEKVYLRGLDNLTTNDIKAFATEYFAAYKPVRIEWIDDTSANLVYEGPDIANGALLAFAAVEIADPTQVPAFQMILAKPFPLHPEINLEVRLAVIGDRKQAGARERSKFYLFNPEHDPAERRKRGGYRGNKYRDRDDGGYRSQRYDDRENRKRRDGNEILGFDANLYDDDEAALASRAARKHSRQDSQSSDGSRERGDRRVRFRGAAGKELFPEQGNRASGRLRDRSASPLRDAEGSQDTERRRDTAASANRLKAQTIKAQLKGAGPSKELFPHKLGVGHRRSGAFDAADATAVLFSQQMSVPFTDGSIDQRPRSNGSPLTSRIDSRQGSELGGLNIRGVAKTSATHEFTIRGTAQENAAKELFPHDNAGKELFETRLEGRGGRRQKAEDLFH